MMYAPHPCELVCTHECIHVAYVRISSSTYIVVHRRMQVCMHAMKTSVEALQHKMNTCRECNLSRVRGN